jgi:hypothetical protein
MDTQACVVAACLVALVGCGRDVHVEADDGAGGGAASSTTTTASFTCGVSDEDLLTCEGVCRANSRCQPVSACGCKDQPVAPECRAEQLAGAKCSVKSCASDCKDNYCHDEIIAFQECEEAHPQ